MKISSYCSNYFSGFGEIYNYHKNTYSINFLAMLKILSYFTVIIPLTVGTVYGISLCGRVSHLTVFDAYNPHFLPKANLHNLEAYSQSEDFIRHAKSARIYYNSEQLSSRDALRVIFQREPTNIAMGENQYDKVQLAAMFGYEKSVYNDLRARKEDGTLFKELPNTAAVYSETFLWDPPGGANKKEVACLSLPAPALDSSSQPHYDYYMSSGQLDVKKYNQEMAFLFNCVERAVRDHRYTAFEGKGLKRVVLSKFGQGAFLEALSTEDRRIAQQIYRDQLAKFLSHIADLKIDVVMSEYQQPGLWNSWHKKIIVGDIVKTAQEGDFIVNAWDPHSAPGNGNDADKSFDGAMGKGSAILLTQTAWLNENLRSPDCLVGVNST
ncbi:MAG: hypothetical protein JSS30_04140 [Verrucomicrobia bacterium]|nr:hypothetical protein [Verrucomicrobiota bacterium]